MDLPAARENLQALQDRFSTVEIAAVSAQTGEGVEELIAKLEKWLAKASQPIAVAKSDPISLGN
jgi:50S ribosomal subunit-associated GTPase HflX